MSPRKIPNMPLCVQDILADERCALMPLEVFGAFMRLLMHQWTEGSIPADSDTLARLLGLAMPRQCHGNATAMPEFRYTAEQVLNSVCEMFAHTNEQGRIYNEHCALERERCFQKAEENRLRALKRWNATAMPTQCHGNATAMPRQCQRNANNISNNILSSKKQKRPMSVGGKRKISSPMVIPRGFKAFWESWPRHKRKANKTRCLAIWRRDELEEMADLIVAKVEAWKNDPDWTKDNGQFIPAPAVWLNQRRWEADVGTNGESGGKSNSIDWDRIDGVAMRDPTPEEARALLADPTAGEVE